MSDGATTRLGWTNVGLGFGFILLDVLVSASFGLGMERSLLTAAVRCVIQLAIAAGLLQQVFAAENPWAVASFALALNLLGTLEVVANKSKRRHVYMFSSVLVVPIVGMLCGSTISGIIVCVSYVLKELQENRDKVEMHLAFGASRMEACKPIAREALRLALTPVINQMSVIGIIAIPGMMTGAILGGSSVQQAARLQMIIMFMICSSTALASFFTTVAVIVVSVDSEHRIRNDRIDERKFGIWRAKDRIKNEIVALFEGIVRRMKDRRRGSEGSEAELRTLLTEDL